VSESITPEFLREPPEVFPHLAKAFNVDDPGGVIPLAPNCVRVFDAEQ
jgi:hypothetical protein